MHLHGFHFIVDATGDGDTDQPLAGEGQRTAVTELVPPGRTFSLSWQPTRAGNWLFHCHMVVHMTPLPEDAAAHHTSSGDGGMSGLVMGIEVSGPPSAPVPAPAKRLSLFLTEEPARYADRHSGFRVDIEGAPAPRLNDGSVPGPVLVLTRNEPTEVTVVNRTSAPTAIHWHGLEIESYFDGVPGFGGLGGQLAPAIEPGTSFVARMAPPRAGTFIYHTHWHDEAQLAGGMYGPLIVLEPGERFDPTVDHILVIGLNGVLDPSRREPFALNGRSKPDPILLKDGVPNRLRLINITANNVALVVSLVSASEAVQWTPLAKDGAAVPPSQSTPCIARQMIGVGETYDFQVIPGAAQNIWLEIRRGNGEWVMQAPVQVR
jgi:FtsP/CotA-like multicopper oxidase with cupredoxin domain